MHKAEVYTKVIVTLALASITNELSWKKFENWQTVIVDYRRTISRHRLL